MKSFAHLLRGGALVALLGTLTTVAACSGDSTGVGTPSGSQLAFTTGTAGSASAASASAIPITKNGHTLDLTAVTVVVDRASLKTAKDDICRSDDDDDDDDRDHGGDRDRGHGCGEVRIGPAIVDLPLDGKLVTLPGNAIPAGTFREIEVRVAMVRLVGTFDTKPFDVTVPVNAKAEVEFETPIVVVADTPVSVTVNLPVDTWLVANDGSLIDPSKLLTNSLLMASVRNRIATSIRAFEDKDHDGREDHKGRR